MLLPDELVSFVIVVTDGFPLIGSGDIRTESVTGLVIAIAIGFWLGVFVFAKLNDLIGSVIGIGAGRQGSLLVLDFREDIS